MAKVIDKTALEEKRFYELSVGDYFKHFYGIFVKLNDCKKGDNAFCFNAGKDKGNPVHVDKNTLVEIVDVEIIAKSQSC